MSKFVSGDWNIICDVCAKKVKASETKRRWDGLIVCKDDYEFRHPQDFLKAKTDKIAVPFVRNPPDVFLCNELAFAIIDYALTQNYGSFLVGTTGPFADYAEADVNSCPETNLYANTMVSRSAIAGLAVGGYSVTGTSFMGAL